MGGKPDKEPEPGDLIEIFRGAYQHWAVYVGDGYVVHLVAPDLGIGSSGSSSAVLVHSVRGQVLKEKLEEVVGQDACRVNNLHDRKRKPRSPQEIVDEALSWVGKDVEYNLFKHNCEHFATSCRYGKEESRQVQDAVEGVGAAAVAAVAAVGVMSLASATANGGRKDKRSQDKRL